METLSAIAFVAALLVGVACVVGTALVGGKSEVRSHTRTH